jgi:hypothetical protein
LIISHGQKNIKEYGWRPSPSGDGGNRLSFLVNF